MKAELEAGQPTLLATFFVRDALCGLNASSVQEVIRLNAMTVAPHAPSDVAGIINLRGRIVTVVDAGIKLGLGRTVAGPDTRIFIVEDNSEFLGLLVDRVSEVVEVSKESEEPLPANIRPAQARYFSGVSRVAGRVIVLLNSAEMLAAGG